MEVFDRRLVRRRRDRAARGGAERFVHAHAARDLAERLTAIRRSFPLAVDLGCGDGVLAGLLGRRPGTDTVIACDLSPAMAAAAAASLGLPALAADEELLPFAAASLDLVASAMALQWVNDLPGCLVQLRRALRPDGLFLAALPGRGTLAELAGVLVEAEGRVSGGASPRVSPFIEAADAGALLQRAGFALPVVDTATLTVTYADAFGLLADLRAEGETAAAVARNPAVPPRALWPEVAQLYAERHAGRDGRIPATVEIVTMTAWAPAEGQQRPLRPGSAAARLADALGAVERDREGRPR
jgi:SAM-dependent methyltransferase